MVKGVINGDPSKVQVDPTAKIKIVRRTEATPDACFQISSGGVITSYIINGITVKEIGQ